jgi:hypothetical protein
MEGEDSLVWRILRRDEGECDLDFFN